MQTPQRFSALYTRDFRLFWFGQIISLSGTWMHSVAQSWLVYSLTKSPLSLGIIAAVSSLPILALTLVGGIVADRYPKRNILIVTQALSVLPALALGILTEMRIITIWQVGITAAFLGTINAFDVPARQSFLAEVVNKGDITNAIALNSAAFNGARILGPVIAGFVIAHFGLPACFYLNAASFVAVLFALVKIEAKGSAAVPTGGFIEGIADGWRFVKEEKTVLAIMALVSLFSLFGIPYVTLLPILAGEILKAGAKGLSLLVAATGAGSLVAAVTIAFKGEVKREDLFISLSGAVFSVAIFALGFSRSLPLSLLLIFFAGWGVVSCLATSNSFIQRRVPDALRGRVTSLYILVFLGFAPLGNALIGLAAEAMGTTASLKFLALLCIGGSILFYKVFRGALRTGT
ncbi:MAG: MFS transporter [Nitrospirales bacterium]|nr:MFS transporter [Nitrospirales bacterium]